MEQVELRTSLKFDESEHVETMVLDACPVPAEYVHRVQHYSRVAARSNEMSVWAKLALTPFTIALDVVGGVLVAWLGFGDDDDDDDPVRARVRDNGNLNDGMSRARPRRSGEDEAKWRARENGRR
ncbi:MAG: hypothetical protein ACJAQZ_005184 [Planctomycetota bacterium]